MRAASDSLLAKHDADQVGAIDKGMKALTKADEVAGGVQGAVSQVRAGNYMGGAKALRGVAKTAGAGPRYIFIT